MKKSFRKLSVLVVLCMLVSPVLFAGGAQEGSDAEEDVVSLYASITSIDTVLEAFEEETGVEVENTRVSTSKFISTVMTEFEAGKLKADVLQAPLPVLEILKDEGVIDTVFVPESVSDYPDWAKQDGIYLFGIEYAGLIYNTEEVEPEDVPRRYQDLTDPKWKGHIVMANPENHATTITWLVGLKNHVFDSEEEWREFLKDLAANDPMFVKSFGPTPAPIESGEKKIGISMPKYIVTKAPAPLMWAQLDDQPLMGSPRGIAMTSDAPHPESAKTFMEYFLSKEAMTILANDVGEWVNAKGVFPPIKNMEQAEVVALDPLSDEELQKWGEEFGRIFNP